MRLERDVVDNRVLVSKACPTMAPLCLGGSTCLSFFLSFPLPLKTHQAPPGSYRAVIVQRHCAFGGRRSEAGFEEPAVVHFGAC